MAIDSVSSAVSSTVQAPPQNREAQRPENRESETTRRVERNESRPVERQEAAQAQQQSPQVRQQDEGRRPPVVNTQGQVTGTRINTTA